MYFWMETIRNKPIHNFMHPIFLVKYSLLIQYGLAPGLFAIVSKAANSPFLRISELVRQKNTYIFISMDPKVWIQKEKYTYKFMWEQAFSTADILSGHSRKSNGCY